MPRRETAISVDRLRAMQLPDTAIEHRRVCVDRGFCNGAAPIIIGRTYRSFPSARNWFVSSQRLGNAWAGIKRREISRDLVLSPWARFFFFSNCRDRACNLYIFVIKKRADLHVANFEKIKIWRNVLTSFVNYCRFEFSFFKIYDRVRDRIPLAHLVTELWRVFVTRIFFFFPQRKIDGTRSFSTIAHVARVILQTHTPDVNQFSKIAWYTSVNSVSLI